MGKHKKPAAIGTLEAPTARYPRGRKMQKRGWKQLQAPNPGRKKRERKREHDNEEEREQREQRNITRLR